MDVDAGIASINYGMNFTSAGRRAGSTATNPAAKIQCGHDDSGTAEINPNADPDYGAGLTF